MDFDGELTRVRKRQLLTDVLAGAFSLGGRRTTLSAALPLAASSLKRSVVFGEAQLILPEAA